MEEFEQAKAQEQASILPPSYDIGEEWVQAYIEQFGVEPSFF